MINHNKLYLKLKNYLLERGITVKWWCKKYITDIRYNTAMAQFHGHYEMSDEIRKAINTFFKDENAEINLQGKEWK